MLRILHVAECYAGGVSRAIRARVEAKSDFDHCLLASGADMPEELDTYSSVRTLSGSFASRVLSIRRAIETDKPDLVHAHSSWAGAYSRVAQLGIPIVYEPHCLKFDDPGLSALKKYVFKSAEQLLASRTTVFGALSYHEAELIRSVAPRARIIRVNNIPSVLPQQWEEQSKVRSRITMAGRISPQKGIDYFIELTKQIASLGTDLRPTWVGEGDPVLKKKLEDAGITVTGWLGAEDLSAVLRESVYVHTASYEGFPLSVLDAAAVNSPVVARQIPAFDGSLVATEGDVRVLAQKAVDLAKVGLAQEQSLLRNRDLLQQHRMEALALQLDSLYAEAFA